VTSPLTRPFPVSAKEAIDLQAASAGRLGYLLKTAESILLAEDYHEGQ
jgi:hypothetical protein